MKSWSLENVSIHENAHSLKKLKWSEVVES